MCEDLDGRNRSIEKKRREKKKKRMIEQGQGNQFAHACTKQGSY
jgi:hypothetical protein